MAVKKSSSMPATQEEEFDREVKNMLRVKHKNIIRFLGYCSDVAEQELVMDGEVTTAEKWERLLCFEYLSNGNLSKHISGMIIEN